MIAFCSISSCTDLSLNNNEKYNKLQMQAAFTELEEKR